MLTVIDLSRVQQPQPLVSDRLLTQIQETLANKGRVYLYLNQKGASHCLVCDTCKHMSRCTKCDHLLRYHTQPSKHLRCHICNMSHPIITTCPQKKCQGTMREFGARIQGVERSLQSLFPDAGIVRIESPKSSKDILHIHEADIIIGTQVSMYLDLKDIDLVGILLLESELNVAQYDIEEKIYHSVRTMSRFAPKTYIQTYHPDLPILQDLVSGNFKSFFQRTLAERKLFGYPPFGEMVEIYVERKTEKQLDTFTQSLTTKLDRISPEDVSMLYSITPSFPLGRVYRQKITLRGNHLQKALDQLSVEIMKNPGVWLEYC